MKLSDMYTEPMIVAGVKRVAIRVRTVGNGELHRCGRQAYNEAFHN
ncbi:hypothetical protein ACFLV7_00925 [Chloroflexota bacterium]